MAGMVAIPCRLCADATWHEGEMKRTNTEFLGDPTSGGLTNFDRPINWIMRLKKYYERIRKCIADRHTKTCVAVAIFGQAESGGDSRDRSSRRRNRV